VTCGTVEALAALEARGVSMGGNRNSIMVFFRAGEDGEEEAARVALEQAITARYELMRKRFNESGLWNVLKRTLDAGNANS